MTKAHPEKRSRGAARRPPGKKHTQELLDKALADTFPASDPPAMLEPSPRQRKRRKQRTTS